MRPVLVLGSRGQLGNELVRMMIAKNISFSALDKEEADITSEVEITREIAKINPRVVINTAAHTDVEDCERNKELATSVNGLGARNVAHACKKIGARLIQISTDYVFDGKSGKYVEGSATNPLNHYGKSKEIGEKEVLNIDSNNCVVRTATLFGIKGSRIKKTNCVENFLKISKKEGCVRAVNDQFLNVTYAVHLSKSLIEMTERIEEFRGIYHLTNEGEITWKEFAEEIMKEFLISKEVVPISMEEGIKIFNSNVTRPLDSTLLNRRAAEKGIRLPSWKEGLKEYSLEKKQKNETFDNHPDL